MSPMLLFWMKADGAYDRPAFTQGRSARIDMPGVNLVLNCETRLSLVWFALSVNSSSAVRDNLNAKGVDYLGNWG